MEIDKIAIEPGNVPLRPGETYDLKAIGYKDGRSVGDITGLGNLTWKSSKPDVARHLRFLGHRREPWPERGYRRAEGD